MFYYAGLDSFQSEQDLVDDFLNSTEQKARNRTPTLAGVVLTKLSLDSVEDNVEYKLRFPSTLRSASPGFNVNPLNNKDHWFTQFMFPVFQKVGPRSNDSTQGGSPGNLSVVYLLTVLICQNSKYLSSCLHVKQYWT